MNRRDAVAVGGIQNALDIQVAFWRGRSPDMRRFIGLADVHRGAVRVGIDGHRTDTHLPYSADDAERDLTTVGDQNFWKH